MKKMFLLTGLILFAFIFAGCVANKTVTDGGTIPPPDTKFLSSDEVKGVFSGKTITWKKLNKDQEGESIHYPDGTFFRYDGTWEVTEDGFRCQNTKRGKTCTKVLKKGDKYIGVTSEGNEIFEFTSNRLTDGKTISVTPASGEYLSPDEVKQMYSGNIISYKSLKKDKSDKAAYFVDGTWAYMVGTWRVTEDGLKCNYWNYNGKEYCGKVFVLDSTYYITNKDGNKAMVSFIVK